MSDNERKNKDQDQLTDEELWGKKFEEDMEDYSPQTRAERRAQEEQKKGKSSNWLAVAVIVLAAIFIIPTLYVAWSRNDANEFGSEQDKIEVTEKSEEEKKREAEERKKRAEERAEKERQEQEERERQEQEEAKREAEAQAEREAEEERQRQQAEAEREAEAERQAEQNQSSASEAQNAQSETPSAQNTYVVQPQDNLYRIALNHGMTTEEIMELNGLTSTTIQVGQVLKVK